MLSILSRLTVSDNTLLTLLSLSSLFRKLSARVASSPQALLAVGRTIKVIRKVYLNLAWKLFNGSRWKFSETLHGEEEFEFTSNVHVLFIRMCFLKT